MDFTLTEEQKQIKALVKDFCEREIDKKRMDDIEDKVYHAKTCDEVIAVFPRDLLVKLDEVGLRDLGIPQKYGGAASETDANLTRTIASEEMGYWAPLVAPLLATGFMNCVCAGAGSPSATEEQRQEFYSFYKNNPTLWWGAHNTDPTGGTDIHLPYDEVGVGQKSIFAHKDGEEWVINGDKMFSSGGAVADFLLVNCMTDKNAKLTKSMTGFLVPTNVPGYSRILNRFSAVEIIGNCQSYFDNVRVPESAVIGLVGEGWKLVETALRYKFTMLVPFLGEIQRAYDDVVQYAKERVQGGKPIIKHSMVAAMLGEAATKIEALRYFTYKTAWETDQYDQFGGPPNLFWSQGYKYLYKTIGLRVSEIANEIYGGVGKSLDMPLEKFNRRIFTWQAAGTSAGINAVKCSMAYNDHSM